MGWPKWFCPVIARVTSPATIASTSAATLPMVEMLLNHLVMPVPARLMASRTAISTTKPIVVLVEVTASLPPTMPSTVVTTAVAITPQAIAPAMKRVTPT